MLDASAKLANIAGSVQEYIATELAATFAAATAIDFGGGAHFSDEPLSEWLQVRLLEPARPAYLVGPGGTVDAETLAQEMYWLLNLNIFVRPAKQSSLNNLRVPTLRDAVLAKLMPTMKIPVQDYSNDRAFIGNLVCDEIMADRLVTDPMRADNELVQHNIVISMRWTEQWTAS